MEERLWFDDESWPPTATVMASSIWPTTPFGRTTSRLPRRPAWRRPWRAITTVAAKWPTAITAVEELVRFDLNLVADGNGDGRQRRRLHGVAEQPGRRGGAGSGGGSGGSAETDAIFVPQLPVAFVAEPAESVFSVAARAQADDLWLLLAVSHAPSG